MTDTVTQEAAEFLSIMLEETRLPGNWDTSGFWLCHAQQLAQFLADHRTAIGIEDAAMLVGLGGMLVEMAKREREAGALVSGMFRRKGGAA